jgi:hypothetical protein
MNAITNSMATKQVFARIINKFFDSRPKWWEPNEAKKGSMTMRMLKKRVDRLLGAIPDSVYKNYNKCRVCGQDQQLNLARQLDDTPQLQQAEPLTSLRFTHPKHKDGAMISLILLDVTSDDTTNRCRRRRAGAATTAAAPAAGRPSRSRPRSRSKDSRASTDSRSNWWYCRGDQQRIDSWHTSLVAVWSWCCARSGRRRRRLADGRLQTTEYVDDELRVSVWWNSFFNWWVLLFCICITYSVRRTHGIRGSPRGAKSVLLSSCFSSGCRIYSRSCLMDYLRATRSMNTGLLLEGSRGLS